MFVDEFFRVSSDFFVRLICVLITLSTIIMEVQNNLI